MVGEGHPGVDGKRMVGLDSQIRFLEDIPGVGMIDKSLRRKVTTMKKKVPPGVCARRQLGMVVDVGGWL